jgi:hypothetical protein
MRSNREGEKRRGGEEERVEAFDLPLFLSPPLPLLLEGRKQCT